MQILNQYQVRWGYAAHLWQLLVDRHIDEYDEFHPAFLGIHDLQRYAEMEGSVRGGNY